MEIASGDLNLDCAVCFQVTNVASQCGYTESNYVGLQKLYDNFHASGFEVRPSRKSLLRFAAIWTRELAMSL